MNDEEVSNIINKLSSILQDELSYEIRGNILKNCLVISRSFSPLVIKKIVQLVEEVRFSPEDRILTVLYRKINIQIDSEDDSALYIINKGEIDIVYEQASNEDLYQNQKTHIKTLVKGDSFGEIGFFTGQVRCASAFSRGFSKAYKIKRAEMLNLLQ